jgi:hypothetical protein
MKSFQFDKLTESATAIFRKASDSKSASAELIPFFCAWFDCQWGTYWHVDSTKLLLTPAFCWGNESVRAEKLRRDTATRSLTLSEGTAGHVWQKGIPICTDNLVRDMCLPRSLDASESGLRGGIWFPIRTEQRTYAVVELLGRHSWKRDERFIEALTVLGFELGKVCASLSQGLSTHRAAI